MGNWYTMSEMRSRPGGGTELGLETSLNPVVTFRRVLRHRFSRREVSYYVLLNAMVLLAFGINRLPCSWKIGIGAVWILISVLPFTSQFFWNAYPILVWLAVYFSSADIPCQQRNNICVETLPAIETILYGDNLSNVVSEETNVILDLLAWIPYGLLHFAAPFFVAVVIFIFGPPTILQSYSFAFGNLNLIGVLIQVLFPNAPPWYKNLYGLAPAHYGMKGSPGGLARIDKLLHSTLYSKKFAESSIIFGAMPSLHAGCCTLEVLFLSYCFPKLKFLFFTYNLWLWWSTMYLTHHYFVDLIAGSVLSFVFFMHAKYTIMPKVIRRLRFRWSYSTIETYNMTKCNPLAKRAYDIENIKFFNYEKVLDHNS